MITCSGHDGCRPEKIRPNLQRIRRRSLIALMLFACGCKSVSPTAGLQAAAAEPAAESVLTILHTNDTHSHFDETDTDLFVDGQKLSVALGGYPRLATRISEIRNQISETRPVLLLQAGDAFGGTLYFSQMHGLVSAKMMNFLQYDAMVLGDHEFDLGSGALAAYADDVAFPLLAANLNAEADPLLRTRIQPFTVVEKNDEQIGIIGILRESPSAMWPATRQLRFEDEATTAARYVSQLNQMGIKKIVLLTHVGYDMDLVLARRVKGIAAIIGGDSHSLLGDLTAAGLPSDGPYPTVVESAPGHKVCVVQAWEKALIIGRLDIAFDANGNVKSCAGSQTLAVGEDAYTIQLKNGAKVPLAARAKANLESFIKDHPPLAHVALDPKAAAVLQPYKDVVTRAMSERIAQVECDLPLAPFLDARDELAGEAPVSQAGALVAKAFLWKARQQHFTADAALLALDQVRGELKAGPALVRDALRLQPQGHKLFVVTLGKAELTSLLENAVNAVATLPQVYGLGMAVNLLAPSGERISRLELQKGEMWQPLGEFEKVRLIVSEPVISGSGGLKVDGASTATDTGLIDNEALIDYLRTQRNIVADTSQHVSWTTAR